MKLRSVIFASGLLLFLCSCASDSALISGIKRYNAFTFDIQVSEKQTMSVEQAMEHHGAQGVSLIIIENGNIAFSAYHGLENSITGIETDQNTVYQAASLSKMVVGLGMAKADRTGVISLDHKLSDHFQDNLGKTVSGWASRRFINKTDRMEGTTLRRLLQNTAGTSRPTTGTSCNASSTSIKAFLGTFAVPCISKCVSNLHEPGTKYAYSSGGYVVAQAMFEEHSNRKARVYLNNDILDAYGLNASTFNNASNSINHLAEACDQKTLLGQFCSCQHEIARVKFPGGLLANPRDYAQLLSYIINDGEDSAGNSVIPLEDIHQVISPAHHTSSSLVSCSTSANCGSSENCFQNQCIEPLGDNGNWYGLGVHLSSRLAADGYPAELFHTGGQDGFTTYFNIDRSLANGLVLFINGPEVKGGASRKAFKTDLVKAFERHYR